MAVTKSDLIALLRLRYDEYSAEAVFELACQRAELPRQDAFDDRELAAFRTALAIVGDRVKVPLARIDDLLAAPPVVAAAPPPAVAAAATTPEEPAAPTPPTLQAQETTIVLTDADVAAEDEILVCGGAPVLGNWEPEHARPMSRKGDAWTCTLELASSTDVPFKFVRRAADGTLLWEPGENRQLTATSIVKVAWRR